MSYDDVGDVGDQEPDAEGDVGDQEPAESPVSNRRFGEADCQAVVDGSEYRRWPRRRCFCQKRQVPRCEGDDQEVADKEPRFFKPEKYANSKCSCQKKAKKIPWAAKVVAKIGARIAKRRINRKRRRMEKRTGVKMPDGPPNLDDFKDRFPKAPGAGDIDDDEDDEEYDTIEQQDPHKKRWYARVTCKMTPGAKRKSWRKKGCECKEGLVLKGDPGIRGSMDQCQGRTFKARDLDGYRCECRPEAEEDETDDVAPVDDGNSTVDDKKNDTADVPLGQKGHARVAAISSALIAALLVISL